MSLENLEKKNTAGQGGVRRKYNFLIFATPGDRKLGACVWQCKISISENILFTLARVLFSPEARIVAPLELQVCSHMYMSQPALLLTCSSVSSHFTLPFPHPLGVTPPHQADCCHAVSQLISHQSSQNTVYTYALVARLFYTLIRGLLALFIG